VKKRRHYLFTFQGALQEGYLTDIRQRIFDLKKSHDTEIIFIGVWHFNEIVYSKNQNKDGDYIASQKHDNDTHEYNRLLLDSIFSLCPSGTGPNSIRLWESLAIGTIPVILSDELELPVHPLWNKAILRVPENKLHLVEEYLRSFSDEEILSRRGNCLKIYSYFRTDFRNKTFDPELNEQQIIHYCCGSYEIGDYGGVAAYDFQLRDCFPNRRFFKGPQHKDKLLSYLESCNKPPIVFTDNHLACDIPNKFFVFIVHHGCARHTAQANPDWDKIWKELCTAGQDQMLTVRDPENTHIISISEDVTRHFINYYGEKYTKFKRSKILHCSAFDESLKKSHNTTDKPSSLKTIVLGNFGGKKGDISKLIRSTLSQKFAFRQLNVKGNKFKDNVTFTSAKQDEYMNADMFLQISNSEGNSYATLDAASCGLAIVATPVGLFYEMPEDSFVKIDIDRTYDIDYMEEKLAYASENRAILGNRAREWVKQNCSRKKWTTQMSNIVKSVKAQKLI
jgi:hypothetical protein